MRGVRLACTMQACTPRERDWVERGGVRCEGCEVSMYNAGMHIVRALLGLPTYRLPVERLERRRDCARWLLNYFRMVEIPDRN